MAGIHWALRLCFMSEMNPLVTLVQFTLWNQGWDECVMALWGQAVGVLVAIAHKRAWVRAGGSMCVLVQVQAQCTDACDVGGSSGGGGGGSASAGPSSPVLSPSFFFRV